MPRVTRIHPDELAEIYKGIQRYIQLRYDEYSYEELQAIRKLLENINEEFKETEGNEEGIPRLREKAGRKSTYSEENAELILNLREQGLILREIAERAGCSMGRVQYVLEKHRHDNENKDELFWESIERVYGPKKEKAGVE